MDDKIKKNNAFFRQLLFITALVAIGVVLFIQLDFLLGAFWGAIVFYIVFRNMLFRMTDKHGWRPGVAAMTLTAGLTAVLLAIGFFVFEVVADEIADIDTTRILLTMRAMPDKINGLLGFAVVSDGVFSQMSGFYTKLASGVLNSAYSFAINVFLMLVILYFMLAFAHKMERKALAYSPFKGQSLELLTHEMHNMIYSNAVGIPVVMLSQGIAAGLTYWAFGIDDAIFWAFITAFCGLIPMIGTMIVSIPMGLFLIAGGAVWQGILLMFIGLFVVANVDNVVRIVLMGRVANTSPLVVIFGVILGIPIFGFWGIIFGPLLISTFLLLIKIYYVEYNLLDPEEARSRPGPQHPGERIVHRAYHAVKKKSE